MLRAYTIYDKKSNSYNTPFFALTDEIALRSFDDLIRDKRSVVGQHPEDFSLFFICVFDELTGRCTEEPSGLVLVCDGMVAFGRVLRYDKDFQTMIKQMTAEPAESQS